ncbi:MAG TPA: OmpA family protein [Steroidobacteraceae bacterium]
MKKVLIATNLRAPNRARGVASQLFGALLPTVAALLAACATTPPINNELEQARSAVQSLSAEPLAQQAAAKDLESARDSLRLADAAQQQRKPVMEVNHLAYLAQRHADAGEARVSEARARQEVARSTEDRNRVLLEARTREAQTAQSQAQAAQLQAQAAQSQADQSRQQLEATQQQLRDMQAKQTERGMVLTLGDVLFDTGKATLKPGAQERLDRLATFLQRNPSERVIIEGYTDSTGTEDFNQALSQRRAEAVSGALLSRGVPSDRVQPIGKGQSFPVATNSTQAGRQQNRRVEVVFSDQAGRFAQGPQESVVR